MPNIGKRKGDSKKAKDVSQMLFFHNPNDGLHDADPVQQFDILSGVEKDKKVRPKEVFENYREKPKKKKAKPEPEKVKHRGQKMEPAQVRGKKRGLDKKQPAKFGQKK
jgi:hypothetical protein